MALKSATDLKVGDYIKLSDPDGTGRIILIRKSKIFGNALRVAVKVIDGPHVGKTIKDQHISYGYGVKFA